MERVARHPATRCSVLPTAPRIAQECAIRATIEPGGRKGVMRKLRTQRDNQQWMLDLALNLRGRVQNFERDDLEVPQGKRARNYRMLPKVWREAAARHEALAKRAQAMGFNETATWHYDHAIESYRMAQHPIYFDDHPVKIDLNRKLTEMVARG